MSILDNPTAAELRMDQVAYERWQEASRALQEAEPPAFDKGEIWRTALQFQNNIRRWSRTEKAALIRLDAAEYLVCGKPYPADIARRHRVSERRVLQAVREVRNYIGILA